MRTFTEEEVEEMMDSDVEYCDKCGYIKTQCECEKPKTNFDICCESVENMAQVIDIAKCGWTREEIIKWLQSEVEE